MPLSINSITTPLTKQTAPPNGTNQPTTLLILFPSTLAGLSPSVAGRTLRLSNAHVYTADAALRLATNGAATQAIVAFAYTSVHCPSLDEAAAFDPAACAANAGYCSHACPARQLWLSGGFPSGGAAAQLQADGGSHCSDDATAALQLAACCLALLPFFDHRQSRRCLTSVLPALCAAVLGRPESISVSSLCHNPSPHLCHRQLRQRRPPGAIEFTLAQLPRSSRWVV